MSDPTYLQPPADRRVKIPHLVFGLLFLGIAGIWALVASGVINADRLPLIAPAVLIGAGVIGLATSLASSRNRSRRLPAGPHPAGDVTDTTAYPVADQTQDPTQDRATGPAGTHPDDTEEIR